MAGVLSGIARHARSRGTIEVLDRVRVTVEAGLDGDFRGALKPGRNRRQVSLMEAGDWERALAELGRAVPWWKRRCNLLVAGIDLPQQPGARLRVGPVLIEITMECNPCSRMEQVAPGLCAALTPDWRGGALGRVLEGGEIAMGDEIGVEE